MIHQTHANSASAANQNPAIYLFDNAIVKFKLTVKVHNPNVARKDRDDGYDYDCDGDDDEQQR